MSIRNAAAATLLCMASTTAAGPKRVLLAAPRGYCAGVDRAVQTVERALELYGAPVYVRKEIVHNKHVVEQLSKRGAVFVEEETEVPEGAIVVFCAHGVAPAVHDERRRAAACARSTPPARWSPRSTSRRASSPREGYTIVLIGHDGHEEVEGTMGEAPDSDRPGRDRRGRRRRSRSPIPDKVAFITQTTLSVDETAAIIAAAARALPGRSSAAQADDICYATTNRQLAVKQLARECDLVLVIGSTQLLELQPPGRGRPRARRRLAPDRQRTARSRRSGSRASRRVGITSGASAPEELVAAPRRVLPRARRRATSRSCDASTRTCASCSPRRSGRRWRFRAYPGRSST